MACEHSWNRFEAGVDVCIYRAGSRDKYYNVLIPWQTWITTLESRLIRGYTRVLRQKSVLGDCLYAVYVRAFSRETLSATRSPT